MGHDHGEEKDEHVWLSLKNAQDVYKRQPLPQLFRHGKVVFLIPDQPVPLHEGQLVAQRAALHVQVVR